MSKHFNPFTRKREERSDDGKISLGYGLCRSETAQAIQVQLGNGSTLWIPQSCVHADSEVWERGQAGDVIVAAWWAEKEGLS